MAGAGGGWGGLPKGRRLSGIRGADIGRRFPALCPLPALVVQTSGWEGSAPITCAQITPLPPHPCRLPHRLCHHQHQVEAADKEPSTSECLVSPVPPGSTRQGQLPSQALRWTSPCSLRKLYPHQILLAP